MATTASSSMQVQSQMPSPTVQNVTCDPTSYYQDGFITMGDRKEPRCMYCDTECSGGCIGPSSADCVSCKNLQFYSYCLTECPFGYKAEDPNQDNHCYMATSVMVVIFTALILLAWLLLSCFSRWHFRKKSKNVEIPDLNYHGTPMAHIDSSGGLFVEGILVASNGGPRLENGTLVLHDSTGKPIHPIMLAPNNPNGRSVTGSPSATDQTMEASPEHVSLHRTDSALLSRHLGSTKQRDEAIKGGASLGTKVSAPGQNNQYTPSTTPEMVQFDPTVSVSMAAPMPPPRNYNVSYSDLGNNSTLPPPAPVTPVPMQQGILIKQNSNTVPSCPTSMPSSPNSNAVLTPKSYRRQQMIQPPVLVGMTSQFANTSVLSNGTTSSSMSTV